jgi:DNA polymerase-1
LKSLSQELDKTLNLRATVLRLQIEKFNLASPNNWEFYLKKLKLGGPNKRKQRTKSYTAGEDSSYLAKDSEKVCRLALINKNFKTPICLDAVTKRIHTDYMQTVATGRLSSTNQNLQNIPIHRTGTKIRKAFIARDENYIISAVTLKLNLCVLHGENMIKAFLNNEDIHKSTAKSI